MPDIIKVKFPLLKYEYKSTVFPRPTDGVKEWWFLFTDNVYFLIEEVIYW